MIRRFASIAAVATALILISPVAAHAAARSGPYVALGDSYTSGPFIPTQVDLNCVRSNRNYPSLTAAAIHRLQPARHAGRCVEI